jgi:hypothetical protein
MDAQQVFEVISSTKSSSTSGFLSKSVNYAILGDLVDLSGFHQCLDAEHHLTVLSVAPACPA